MEVNELQALKYAQLQKLAKKHGIKANQKAAVLRKALEKVLLHDTVPTNSPGLCSDSLPQEVNSPNLLNSSANQGTPTFSPDRKRRRRSGTYELESPKTLRKENDQNKNSDGLASDSLVIQPANQRRDNFSPNRKRLRRSGTDELQLPCAIEEEGEGHHSPHRGTERRSSTDELQLPPAIEEGNEDLHSQHRGTERRSGTYELQLPPAIDEGNEDLHSPHRSTERRSGTYELQLPPAIEEGNGDLHSPHRGTESRSGTYELQLPSAIEEKGEGHRSSTYELQLPSAIEEEKGEGHPSGTYELQLPSAIEEEGEDHHSPHRGAERRSGTYELESPSQSPVYDSLSSTQTRSRKSSVADLPIIDNSESNSSPRTEKVLTPDVTNSSCQQDWMAELMDKINKAADEKEGEIESRVDQKMATLQSTDQGKIKSGKTPNFKKLHEKHFSKMTDIATYHKRKLEMSAGTSRTPSRLPVTSRPITSRPPISQSVVSRPTSASARSGDVRVATPDRNLTKSRVMSAGKARTPQTNQGGGARIVKPIRGGGAGGLIPVASAGVTSSASKVRSATVSSSLFSPTISSLNKSPARGTATTSRSPARGTATTSRSPARGTTTTSRSPARGTVTTSKSPARGTATLSSTSSTSSSRPSFVVGTKTSRPEPTQPDLKRQPLKSRKNFNLQESLRSKPTYKMHKGPLAAPQPGTQVVGNSTVASRRAESIRQSLNSRRQATMSHRGLNSAHRK